MICEEGPKNGSLRAATSHPAAVFPTLDARRIRAVVLAGTFLDRPALDRLLTEALALAERK